MQDASIQPRMGGSVPRPPLTHEQATLRTLSERFIALHRGLRILDTINWPAESENAFLASGGCEMPSVTPNCYRLQSLSLDMVDRRDEFRRLERDIRRTLGVAHPGAQLLLRRCRDSRLVLDLIQARGTEAFGHLSERLYGRPTGSEGLAAQLRRLASKLGTVNETTEESTVSAEEAIQHLRDRFTAFFGSERLVRVQSTTDLAANAAATLDTLKIRHDARFTPREVHLLEVHEGWVHLGTTLNAQAQPICTFLSKCLPSATTTQEGLAVAVEVMAGASHVDRLERLALRVEGILWARQGADFVQVVQAFRDRGLSLRDAYRQGMRIFRGVPLTGGTAFVKDACYARGFVQIARWLHGGDDQTLADLALLTVGKTRREDLPLLRALLEADLLRQPRFIPPVFRRLPRTISHPEQFPGVMTPGMNSI